LYPAEDTVSGQFMFASGAHGTGVWNFNAGIALDQTDIVGDQGKISFSIFGKEPIVLESITSREEFPIVNPLHIQQPLIQTIVDHLLGTGSCPTVAEDVLITSWVMDKMLGRI